MNAATYKRGLSQAFLGLGFKSVGKSLRKDQSDVSVLVSFEKGFKLNGSSLLVFGCTHWEHWRLIAWSELICTFASSAYFLSFAR